MKWYPTGAEEAADLRTLPRREKLRVSQLWCRPDAPAPVPPALEEEAIEAAPWSARCDPALTPLLLTK